MGSFTLDSNQIIWKCADAILSENPRAKLDYPTFLGAAKSFSLDKVFEDTGELTHLRGVMNAEVKLENVRSLAGVVKKLEVARNGYGKLVEAQQNLLELTGRESINQILGAAEQPIIDWTTELSRTAEDGPQRVGFGLREYVNHLANHPTDVIGISSGYKLYDRVLGGGFRPGTVSLIGARIKEGKSAIANNISLRIATGAGYNWPAFDPSKSCPVLQLDVEMSREEQWARRVATLARVSVRDVETGKFAINPDSLRRVNEAVSVLEKIPIDYLTVGGQPFEETLSVMRRWVTKTVGLNDDGTARPCLIIYDYLKLLDTNMISHNVAEYQALGLMMTAMVNFALRYKVPMLTFVQLNRDGISREDSAVVSGSDRPLWTAANFCIFKRMTDEEMAEQIGANAKQRYNRKLIPVVMRHSEEWTFGDYINMNLEGSYMTLKEGPTKSQLEKGVTKNKPSEADESISFGGG